MKITRFLSSLALGLSLSLGSVLSAHAGPASDQLNYLDKTTYSGYLNVHVDLYDPPNKNGQYGAATRYPAQLLFERPDRFRLVLRPGAKNEVRIVAQAGIVRWLDLATGISGKEEANKVTDPLALALLGTAGELMRFTTSKDLVLSKGSKISGAKITPKTWGAGLDGGIAWFSSEGKPIGFEFNMSDGSRVFMAVVDFQPNVPTKPSDFEL